MAYLGQYPSAAVLTSEQIGDNTITSAKIANGVVSAADVADYTITSDKLANSGVTSAVYGGSTQIPVLNIDCAGRVTSAANTSITLGTMATQNCNAVTITGGNITGLTCLTSSNVCATAYYGDGSKLSGINASGGGQLICCAALSYALTSSNCRAVGICLCGSGGVTLPDATTLTPGAPTFVIKNLNCSYPFIVYGADSSVYGIVGARQSVNLSLTNNATCGGQWVFQKPVNNSAGISSDVTLVNNTGVTFTSVYVCCHTERDIYYVATSTAYPCCIWSSKGCYCETTGSFSWTPLVGCQTCKCTAVAQIHGFTHGGLVIIPSLLEAILVVNNSGAICINCQTNYCYCCIYNVITSNQGYTGCMIGDGISTFYIAGGTPTACCAYVKSFYVNPDTGNVDPYYVDNITLTTDPNTCQVAIFTPCLRKQYYHYMGTCFCRINTFIYVPGCFICNTCSSNFMCDRVSLQTQCILTQVPCCKTTGSITNFKVAVTDLGSEATVHSFPQQNLYCLECARSCYISWNSGYPKGEQVCIKYMGGPCCFIYNIRREFICCTNAEGSSGGAFNRLGFTYWNGSSAYTCALVAACCLCNGSISGYQAYIPLTCNLALWTESQWNCVFSSGGALCAVCINWGTSISRTILTGTGGSASTTDTSCCGWVGTCFLNYYSSYQTCGPSNCFAVEQSLCSYLIEECCYSYGLTPMGLPWLGSTAWLSTSAGCACLAYLRLYSDSCFNISEMRIGSGGVTCYSTNIEPSVLCRTSYNSIESATPLHLRIKGSGQTYEVVTTLCALVVCCCGLNLSCVLCSNGWSTNQCDYGKRDAGGCGHFVYRDRSLWQRSNPLLSEMICFAKNGSGDLLPSNVRIIPSIAASYGQCNFGSFIRTNFVQPGCDVLGLTLAYACCGWPSRAITSTYCGATETTTLKCFALFDNQPWGINCIGMSANGGGYLAVTGIGSDPATVTSFVSVSI